MYQHRSNFQSKFFAEKSYECYGKITEKADYLEVAILKDVFTKWMAEAEFEDISVVLKGFRDKDLLDHDPDKLTRKRSIKQVTDETDAYNTEPIKSKREITYCIKLPKDFLEVKENGTPPPVTPRRPRKISKSSNNINSLFMDGDN